MYSEYEPLGYGQFLQDIRNFKQAGTQKDDFNTFDVPNRYYFRTLFYFFNGDNEHPDGFNSGGLLAPTWMVVPAKQEPQFTDPEDGPVEEEITFEDWTKYQGINSAYAYLMINNEQERAAKLKQFIELLSNISSKSPWYFQTIDGLGDAVKRPGTMAKEGIKIDEERKKISIKCLPDAVDNRIGTLLDLYKEVTWSWKMKRYIIPANLRKFDMGIYVFSSPIANLHDPVFEGPASINPASSSYITSYKYLEFHNCEIDYNSGNSALEGLDNIEGKEQEFTIDIYFDDCYENRYNEFIGLNIGDMVAWDSARMIIGNATITGLDRESEAPEPNEEALMELEHRANEINPRTGIAYENEQEAVGALTSKKKSGFFSNALKEVKGWATGKVMTAAHRMLYGNMYGLSIKNLQYLVKDIAAGRVFTAGRKIKGMVKGNFNGLRYAKDLGNIYKKNSAIKNI